MQFLAWRYTYCWTQETYFFPNLHSLKKPPEMALTVSYLVFHFWEAGNKNCHFPGRILLSSGFACPVAPYFYFVRGLDELNSSSSGEIPHYGPWHLAYLTSTGTCPEQYWKRIHFTDSYYVPYSKAFHGDNSVLVPWLCFSWKFVHVKCIHTFTSKQPYIDIYNCPCICRVA